MELKDTVQDMLSDNWENRLNAEKDQVIIRIQKLREFYLNSENQATYTKEYLDIIAKQISIMMDYLDILNERFSLHFTNSAKRQRRARKTTV